MIEPLLDEAEKIAGVLSSCGIDAILIGAAAMAAHHHVRMTRDIDLGVAVSLSELKATASELQAHGWEAELNEPGGDDPLDGVLDIITPAGLVQVVNFGGTFPAVIRDALTADPQPVGKGSKLKVIPLPHLIVMKLYAGGRKSELDILELLSRNPDVNRPELTALCRRYRITGLSRILREIGNDRPR